MSDAPQDNPKPARAQVDPRLIEFSYAGDCDINAMKAAVELLQRDPTVVNLLSTMRSPGDSRMDFNHDGNKNANGVVAASNREWASALIAVAQLTREQGLPPEKLNVEDITARGQCIYDEFKKMEVGQKAAVCKTTPVR